MTQDTQSSNRDIEVEPLKKTDIHDPVFVRNALDKFYEAAEKASPSDSHAETIAILLSDAMQRQFDTCSPLSTTREYHRMEALRRSLIGIGRELDKTEKRNAEEGTLPEYHDRAHNLLVFGTMFLRERAALAALGRAPEAEDIIKSMRRLNAALGHDLWHTGKNNKPDGTYVPGYLELKSVEVLGKIFDQTGVEREDQHVINTAILGTDFVLPGDIALAAYVHHHPDANCQAPKHEQLEARISQLAPEHQALVRGFREELYGNKSLAEECMILKGCDMVPSYGISQNLWKTFSQNFHKEAFAHSGISIVDEKDEPIPDGQVFVMENMIGKTPETNLPKFVDGILDGMFGGHLRKLHQFCKAQIEARKPAPEATVNQPAHPVSAAKPVPVGKQPSA